MQVLVKFQSRISGISRVIYRRQEVIVAVHDLTLAEARRTIRLWSYETFGFRIPFYYFVRDPRKTLFPVVPGVTYETRGLPTVTKVPPQDPQTELTFDGLTFLNP